MCQCHTTHHRRGLLVSGSDTDLSSTPLHLRRTYLPYPSEECPSFLRTPSRTFVSDRSYHRQQQRSTTTGEARAFLGRRIRSIVRSFVFVRAKATREAPHPFFLPKTLCCRPQISRPAVTHSLTLSFSCSNTNDATIKPKRSDSVARKARRSVKGCLSLESIKTSTCSRARRLRNAGQGKEG
jgi:hypothetical protein